MAKFHIGYLILLPWLSLLLVPVVFVGVGVWLAIDQERRLVMFIPVDAQVLSSGVQTELAYDDEGDPYQIYTPVVEYQYEIYEQTHTSQQVTALSMSNQSESWARDIVARYPVGRAVDAYVNPNNPAEAFLLREASFFPYAIVLIAMLFVAVEAVVCWRVFVKKKSRPVTHQRLIAAVAWCWWGVGLAAYAHYFWLSGPVSLAAVAVALLYFSVGMLPGRLYLRQLLSA